ncbi:hypothetical protein OKW76_01185 [Sphingomonas sp. S1-29]|uniref:hypothetical protein n=1 Tax=Sphingomonas sp. S1-29 TaxID=2991074 RepID=UPI002240807D|nr:hypothetical protein [Sphingomonas sp. S1-29]UZK69726.1 hypothetical protein OKW76_01185 [Sphingomonas sp. S1-29]
MTISLGFAIHLILAACSGESPRNPAEPLDLETAAIERGLVRDPDDVSLAGLYARDTDRLCLIGEGGAYRIGATVDYGQGVDCSARGTATRAGSTLRVELGDGCAFDATIAGERIVFPPRVPKACARRCRSRASLGALTVDRLSGVEAEARALRDPRGRPLCDSDPAS